MVKREANAEAWANKLIAVAEAAWNKIPEKIVRNSSTCVAKRHKALVRAIGEHVE
ncbi:Hypothetical protein FKW44_013956 [Caligus rogercresseyi]|uniref:Uncharacterized protein n=1 Tax=Caligus rogercresseyi TaxID=217165 RepID=A0A7T8JZL4_CALRO|nr:Hypothetical protein FKW44_013956 [Caligus rogercresseyi]